MRAIFVIGLVCAFQSPSWGSIFATPQRLGGGTAVQTVHNVDTSRVPELGGDYNGSGAIEEADLDLVLQNWGRAPTARSWKKDTPFNHVDQAELDAVLLNWGNRVSPSAPELENMPEPQTLIVWATLFGSLLLVRKVVRRRQSALA